LRIHRRNPTVQRAPAGEPRRVSAGTPRERQAVDGRVVTVESCAAPPRDADALLEFSRTVLRQFRQESGHYYWQVLVAEDPARLRGWREVFGDERRDYAEAMRAHYHEGPPRNWQEEYVSPYASAHPLEDFAETWAHYMYVLALVPSTNARQSRVGRDRDALALGMVAVREAGFRALLRRCLPALLRARRGRRKAREANDLRPIAPPPRVMRKLAWVHRLVQDSLVGMQPAPSPRLAWNMG
jgi:hypothetical protein